MARAMIYTSGGRPCLGYRLRRLSFHNALGLSEQAYAKDVRRRQGDFVAGLVNVAGQRVDEHVFESIATEELKELLASFPISPLISPIRRASLLLKALLSGHPDAIMNRDLVFVIGTDDPQNLHSMVAAEGCGEFPAQADLAEAGKLCFFGHASGTNSRAGDAPLDLGSIQARVELLASSRDGGRRSHTIRTRNALPPLSRQLRAPQ